MKKELQITPAAQIKKLRGKTLMVDQSNCLIPGLPDEVATICLAKIPLSFRLRISRVCRSWRDLFKAKHFWDARREHSATEAVLLVWSQNLYVNGVWHGFYPATEEWFRLPLMPRDDRLKGNSTFAVVDEKLFVIGGIVGSGNACPDSRSSTRVSYFDLKRYEWLETSPLNVGRSWCMAVAVDNLLYVFGGVTTEGRNSTVEVYNPVSKTWNFVSSIPCHMKLVSSVAVKGKIYAVCESAECSSRGWKGGVVYSPEEDKWMELPEALSAEWSSWPVEFDGQICIKRESIEPSDYGESCILGYNPTDNTWRLVHGQRAVENWIYPDRWPAEGMNEGQLLNLDGSLCKIWRYASGDTLEFEIENLTNGHMVSKSLRPCCLHTEAEDSQLLPPDQLDLDDVGIECETVRL